LVKAANNALSEISSGPAEFTQRLLEHNILNIIEQLISHPNIILRSDGYFLLSNIAAGVAEQLKVVFSHKTLLVKSFSGLTDCNSKVRNEAWHVFVNICKFRCKDFLIALFENDILEYVSQAVQIENDPHSIEMILTFLESLLIAGDCLGLPSIKEKFNSYSLFEWISGLRYNKIIKISTKADHIMDSIEYNEEEDN
jgi:hypothetical protein